jgi:serine/threonine protein kinase
LAVSLGIFGQIVDAVRVCHENGLCHRDLKLENIMFDRYHSRVLLVDFGLCSKTQGGLRDIVGSKGYICPEMLYERQHHGIAADAWSLGIILFTLLTHAHPWGHALDGRHIQFEKRREEFWSNPQFAHFTFQQKACLEALLVLNPGDRIQNLASLDIADLQR